MRRRRGGVGEGGGGQEEKEKCITVSYCSGAATSNTSGSLTCSRLTTMTPVNTCTHRYIYIRSIQLQHA